MPVTTTTTNPSQGQQIQTQTQNPNQTDLSPETLETTLLNHLSNTPALEDLHATLLTSLQRSGWTERIRQLTLDLLRAGVCERFDEVVDVVVAAAEGRGHDVLSSSEKGSGDKNKNGVGLELENADVRIPTGVVEEGVKALKDVLAEVVVLEEGKSETGVAAPVPAVKEGSNSASVKEG